MRDGRRMSDSGLDLMTDGQAQQPPGPGRRRASSPPRKPWGRRLVALVVVVALLLAAWFGYQKISDMMSGPEDYVGQGTGKVTVQIPSGAGGQQIATILKDAGVVKSAEAFYQLAIKDSRFQSVQAGYFSLRKKMSAEAALVALIDKGNRVEGKVTIPEGARVGQIVELIAANSEIKEKDLLAALDKPETLGLPDVANLNPEGYLFPATYEIPPGTSATDLLKQMVAKTLDVAKSLDIGTRARALGLTGEEVLTVASILEYEANNEEDYAKVARVLYNRIDQGMPLQLDSTVSYVSKRKGDVFTTPEERADPSKYNTYQNAGLPPGPIGSPGEKTIEAALNPAEGSWLFFVAVNLETGETVFSDTFGEHNKAVAQLQEYCKTAPEGVCG
ncbi:endolytic transglycosylase MltG [Aeromicrobium sp. SMF47]|uniref:Endolytic murein transglycosylase n=3 Tax=Aeromicrobium yanjiei TaxID=2662028 RepID=A0A5Q2MKY3_9ACTN|nr:endolytic transglycosylase MltG [Aeromicrobium yanjiei]QGG41702.1 endolytic transglycosylase MltG [Aeromicrobium yanjiei]